MPGSLLQSSQEEQGTLSWTTIAAVVAVLIVLLRARFANLFNQPSSILLTFHAILGHHKTVEPELNIGLITMNWISNSLLWNADPMFSNVPFTGLDAMYALFITFSCQFLDQNMSNVFDLRSHLQVCPERIGSFRSLRTLFLVNVRHFSAC